jgi:uncharacterized protein YdhG (YjbR/CyaY superfamily)
MATKKPLKATRAPAKTGSRKASRGFTAEERSAMQDRVREHKSDGGEVDVLAAIAKMPDPDRTMAARLHAVIRTNAPALAPKTWYGMPAYAKDDKVVCYFRPAYKFKDRYATFGFNDKARLDEGAMWPTAYALIELGAAEEARITALVRKALG